jgi:hypothetical protein
VKDLPRSAEGDQQIQSLAMSIWNGGQALNRYDKFIEQAPERLRDVLLKTAFQFLPNVSSRDAMFDAQTWIARANQLPETERPAATLNIARAWSTQSPEAAINWANTIPDGIVRSDVVGSIASSWAASDPAGAAAWVTSMSPGKERDSSAYQLAYAIADRYPQQAWEWALSIEGWQRDLALDHLVKLVGAREPTTVRQWIENAPLPSERKAALREIVDHKPIRR